MTLVCAVWLMKPMALTSISETAFLYPLWRQGPTWLRCPCTKAEEASRNPVCCWLDRVHTGYVRQIINLTHTTSGSYLLMSSLDISRRNLALRGREVFHQVADMAEYARQEINAVGGYYAFGRELMNGNSVFDFDTTKLSVHTLDIG